MADETCKLIVLGNGSVGKSSIINRFVQDGFERVYKQTVGLDFYEKLMTIRGDKRVNMQVWDIGGQSIGSQMLSKYIFGANVVFLCYDVTDPQSFSDLEDWHNFVLKAAHESNPFLFLVGNKIDLLHLRQIQEKQHDLFISDHQLHGGFFVSAMNGDHVLKSFYFVAGKAANIELSAHELEFADKVITATVSAEHDEGRTAFADEIERQDREMQQNQSVGKGCQCVVQ